MRRLHPVKVARGVGRPLPAKIGMEVALK
jgi:hypothetical protein